MTSFLLCRFTDAYGRAERPARHRHPGLAFGEAQGAEGQGGAQGSEEEARSGTAGVEGAGFQSDVGVVGGCLLEKFCA